MGGEDDDDYGYQPCCFAPKFTVASLVILFCMGTGVFLWAYLNTQAIDKVNKELALVHVQQYTLEGGMRPQFYTHNRSGDWTVPSAVIMPADGKTFSRTWCTFSENTRTAEIRFLIQATAEVTSGKLQSLVEFRFEVPYGLPLGVNPGSVTEYSRCPAPKCGTSDYRIGVGADNSFQDQESSFFTMGQISQNRTHSASTALECGCSAEIPPRMSCSFHGSELAQMDGSLAIVGNIVYATVNATQPL